MVIEVKVLSTGLSTRVHKHTHTHTLRSLVTDPHTHPMYPTHDPCHDDTNALMYLLKPRRVQMAKSTICRRGEEFRRWG